MNEALRFSNLVEMIRTQSEVIGHQQFAEFLSDDGSVVDVLTYGGLYAEATNIAAELQARGFSGRNVILLYPPGLEYIKAFFACLCAGVIPVPAYPPMGAKDIDRLVRIIKDCEAVAILSQGALAPIIQTWIESNHKEVSIDLLSTDTIVDSDNRDFCVHQPAPNDIAFLQYTSGSTGHPKGVMVSHTNLLENFHGIETCFVSGDKLESANEHYKTVIWLPPFHDMGLIGGILMPLYVGSSVTLMSPLTFLKNPYVWLKAISDRKANVSGGPNFSYRYCIKKITPEQRDTLDLSHWDIAFNGAESIQADALRAFSDYFKSTGFQSNAFLPCYGLAEATLFVSGSPAGRGMLTRPTCLDALALGDSNQPAEVMNRAELVSSGVLAHRTEIQIVNPTSHEKVNTGQIGEIWVNSPSVCQGYWGKPQYSERVFRATIKGGTETTYLRTGDLGFMDKGELFVTGRLKEVIIVAGRNHYPQDIEQSFQSASDSFRKGCGAAFMVSDKEGEQVVMVQEIAKEVDTSDAHLAALALQGAGAVSSRHGVAVKSVVLIKAGSLSKTSSGKIQRVDTKQRYEAHRLSIVFSWDAKPVQEKPDTSLKNVVEFVSDTQQNLHDQMVGWLSERLNVDSHLLDLDLTFAELGVDSIEAIAMIDLLQDYIGRTIPATELLRYPTVNALIKHFSYVRHQSELDGNVANDQHTENEAS